MNARRLVSLTKHFTGSLRRSRPQSFDRATVARAMREYRRLFGRWGTPDDALTQYSPAWRAGFRPEIRIAEPSFDRFRDPRHPGYLFPVAIRRTRKAATR